MHAGVLCRRNPFLHTLKAVEAKTEEELQRDRREQKEMMIQQDLDRVMEVQKDLGRDMDKMQRGIGEDAYADATHSQRYPGPAPEADCASAPRTFAGTTVRD